MENKHLVVGGNKYPAVGNKYPAAAAAATRWPPQRAAGRRGRRRRRARAAGVPLECVRRAVSCWRPWVDYFVSPYKPILRELFFRAKTRTSGVRAQKVSQGLWEGSGCSRKAAHGPDSTCSGHPVVYSRCALWKHSAKRPISSWPLRGVSLYSPPSRRGSGEFIAAAAGPVLRAPKGAYAAGAPWRDTGACAPSVPKEGFCGWMADGYT